MPTATLPAQSAGMARTLLTAAKEVSDADPAIVCQPSPAPSQGFECVHALPEGRYATLGVTVTVAREPLPTGEAVLDDTLMGPGGGSIRYRGQTTDHRYDIVAIQAERLGPDDRSRLPPAPRLIARIVALYAASPQSE